MSSRLTLPAENAKTWGLSLCHTSEEKSMNYGHPPAPFVVTSPSCKCVKRAGRNNGECRDEDSSLRREERGLVSHHGCAVSLGEGARSLNLIGLELLGGL